jgi:L-alanine-DL-glutamate epimerase-like enolase superfamily enzyme
VRRVGLPSGRLARRPSFTGEASRLFGLSGFSPLIRQGAVDTIMPDVKHCGGLRELTRIAALAAEEGVMVAPHNTSGRVSTAASVQVCAGMKNVSYLELQYGEVGWRPDALAPPGAIRGRNGADPGTTRFRSGPQRGRPTRSVTAVVSLILSS